MCVLSMVVDHYRDKWFPPPVFNPPIPLYQPILPTQAEIEEFCKLLDRAREYDKKYNQPDCGMEEKRKQLRELAKSFGDDVAKQIDRILEGASGQ